ncbi:CETP protein, partial [Amia calva]|nr:CETP protein [Amia calva]
MWSLLPPQLWTTPQGTSVRTVAAVELKSSSSDPEPSLLFHTEVEVVVQASYADKQLILDVKPTEIVILKTLTAGGQELDEDVDVEYLKEVVRKIGIPKVVSDLEPGLTKMMDSHGLHLFDIINPEVISQQGYVVVQLDFGFPHHLLVEFLQKTLQSSAASSTAEEN